MHIKQDKKQWSVDAMRYLMPPLMKNGYMKNLKNNKNGKNNIRV